MPPVPFTGLLRPVLKFAMALHAVACTVLHPPSYAKLALPERDVAIGNDVLSIKTWLLHLDRIKPAVIL